MYSLTRARIARSSGVSSPSRPSASCAAGGKLAAVVAAGKVGSWPSSGADVGCSARAASAPQPSTRCTAALAAGGRARGGKRGARGCACVRARGVRRGRQAGTKAGCLALCGLLAWRGRQLCHAAASQPTLRSQLAGQDGQPGGAALLHWASAICCVRRHRFRERELCGACLFRFPARTHLRHCRCVCQCCWEHAVRRGVAAKGLGNRWYPTSALPAANGLAPALALTTHPLPCTGACRMAARAPPGARLLTAVFAPPSCAGPCGLPRAGRPRQLVPAAAAKANGAGGKKHAAASGKASKHATPRPRGLVPAAGARAAPACSAGTARRMPACTHALPCLHARSQRRAEEGEQAEVRII